MYCDAADVEALNANRKQTFDAATIPSLTQVNNFITQIAGEIDAVLSSKGYTVPVTATEYLKMMNAMGAAGMVEAAKNMEGTAEINASRDWRWTKYNSMLADLKKSPEYSGASASGTGSRSNETSNYTNDNMSFQGDGKDW